MHRTFVFCLLWMFSILWETTSPVLAVSSCSIPFTFDYDARSSVGIDPQLAMIIGQAEPDGPIALDYRTSPPRVVYLGIVDDQSYWIELAPDYDSLIVAIITN